MKERENKDPDYSYLYWNLRSKEAEERDEELLFWKGESENE